MPAGNFVLTKKKKLLAKVLVTTVALFVLFGALNIFNLGIRNAFFGFSRPFQNICFEAGNSVSGFFGSFLNAGAYLKENRNLKAENQQLLAQISSLQSVVSGNAALTAVSQACQNDSFNLKMAGVIGLAADDQLTINKGFADGISEGMPVINQQKALIGVVYRAYKGYSEISLISRKKSVVNVKVISAKMAEDEPEIKEVDGVIKGAGGMNIYLDLVPIDDVIMENDVLVTSALEGVFPKDLLVGKIIKIIKDDHNPHQQAQVQPFFNISTDNLFVITNYKQKQP